MGGDGWWAAGVCALLGLVLGWSGRLLLARLSRGAVLPAGMLELMAAAACLVTGLLVWPAALIIPAVWAAVLLVVLSAVDLKHHRLPDAITLPAVPLTLLILVSVKLWDPLSGSLLRALLAAAVLGGLFFGTAALAPAAMGRGDAKLVLSLGLLLGYLSWPAVIIAMALAFVLGGLVGVIGMIFGGLKLRSALPFGPFLLVATWIMLLFAQLPQFLAR